MCISISSYLLPIAINLCRQQELVPLGTTFVYALLQTNNLVGSIHQPYQSDVYFTCTPYSRHGTATGRGSIFWEQLQAEQERN